MLDTKVCVYIAVRMPGDLDDAFQTLARERVEALVDLQVPLEFPTKLERVVMDIALSAIRAA